MDFIQLFQLAVAQYTAALSKDQHISYQIISESFELDLNHMISYNPIFLAYKYVSFKLGYIEISWIKYK